MHHMLFLIVNGELMRQQLPNSSNAPLSLLLSVLAAAAQSRAGDGSAGVGEDAEQSPCPGSRTDLHPKGSALCSCTQIGFFLSGPVLHFPGRG